MAWDPAKNERLKETRGVSFEEVLDAIGEYVYIVPFVEDEEKIFLKTIYPSRKYTKQYIEKGGV